MPDLLNPMGMPIGQFRIGYNAVSIHDNLGIQVGYVKMNGAICNNLGLEVGRVGPNSQLLDTVGIEQGPVIFEPRVPSINSIGIGGSAMGIPSRQTTGETLMRMLGVQSYLTMLPPSNPRSEGFSTYLPPAASPAVSKGTQRPIEERYPDLYQQLGDFAASYSGLQMPAERAWPYAKKLLWVMVDKDLTDSLERVLEILKARYEGLTKFASDCLGKWGSDSQVWAWEHLSVTQNIQLLTAYYKAFNEWATSYSGPNMDREPAEEWALQQAIKWVPRDIPNLIDPFGPVGRIYERQVENQLDYLRSGMDSIQRWYEMEFKQRHRSRFWGGLGLSDREARQQAFDEMEAHLKRIFGKE